MNTVLEKIKKMGIVPVVVIENEKDAVPLADALCNGGLACAEVTFRTAAAGEAIRLMKEAQRLNDDAVMLIIVDQLEQMGICVLDQTIFIKNLMAPPGVLGVHEPDEDQALDVEYGYWLAKEMGKLDVGQSVVIKNKMIMAVEAIEGTDKCIERGCKLGGKGITVVKVSKPTQDKRFDIPAIGLNTLKTMDRYGAKILAIEANETIIVDQKKVIDFANKKGIIVMAI